MQTIDLSGAWRCEIPGIVCEAILPGTLDENAIGFPDTGANQWHPDEAGNAELITPGGPIATRLTRRFTFEGAARFSRRLNFRPPDSRRVFLECERARQLSLRINGKDVPPFLPRTLSTPQIFEVTGLLTGDDLIELTSDNSYPGWPRADIVYSSAATDETQTNWNGILGDIRLRIENPVFIHALRVYPQGDVLRVCVDVCADHSWENALHISSDALAKSVTVPCDGNWDMTRITVNFLKLRKDVCRWDEDEGSLYTLSVSLFGESKTVRFGVRDFASEGSHLTLNGRRFFLRGEANCAVFPETGHPPMDIAAWREILALYRSYGVNCMRFHSHCPPEAAFTAADEMGMLMQCELSHWNPKNAFSTPESRAYYQDELEQILLHLANHPSFVMLSLGNELHADSEGNAFMDTLIRRAKALDPTRLYAEGSNNHYGQRGAHETSDFYTSDSFGALRLRATSSTMVGWLNEQGPDFTTTYAAAMAAIREKYAHSVFSFEVGQYEILPDFGELSAFRGVTIPDNLRLIRDRAQSRGLLDKWKEYVEATGELSLLCYRAEIEAALRTDNLSGISLLGLQDFPGQGTALVGMINSHMRPKPYNFARPERFRAFLCGVLPLCELPRFAYGSDETLTARVRMANYGKETLCAEAGWSLTGDGVSLGDAFGEMSIPCGGVHTLGELRIPLGFADHPRRLTLRVYLGEHENTYPIWVYPDETPVCPEGVYECRALDDRAIAVLNGGGAVYLAPDSTKEALPHSIKSQLSTDFWSVGTFAAQEGGMGQLIDKAHPIFRDFPTDFHTNWQWWPMAAQRAAILPRPMNAIVTVMDSYAYMRPMAQLMELRCAGGRVLFSTLGLHNLEDYPQARALQRAIYRHIASDRFAPAQEMTLDELLRLCRSEF
ncbi:MAG: hypothetical protein E7321_07095 [Clostridiales bacterium]|nr:hypothetical protein [Clostridiales bacterium]